MKRKTNPNRIRKKIRKAIREQYDMSVPEFCKSKHVKKLGIKPESLQNYLSERGSFSYNALRIVYEFLELGTIDRDIEIIKTVTYYTVK